MDCWLFMWDDGTEPKHVLVYCDAIVKLCGLWLTLQTYSSSVRTSTHRHSDEPSTCSSSRYLSATRAAWNCWGCGLAGAGGAGDGGDEASRSSAGDAARSALLCSPDTTAGLLSRNGHSSEGDPGSITTHNTVTVTLKVHNTRTPTLTQELRWDGHDLEIRNKLFKTLHFLK